jgi:D-alanyl-D-alanine carboxypeptidase
MLSLILSPILSIFFIFPPINTVDLGFTAKLIENRLLVQEEKNNQQPPLRIKGDSLKINPTAKSFIIIDEKTKRVLLGKSSKEKLPIASITKLMTALVFLETKPDWNKEIAMIEKDEREGSRINVKAGDILKVRDLFYSALVGSANNAIMALVRSTGQSQDEFIRKMNEKAKSLGLRDTNFVEPTGLNQANISTVYEIAELTREALQNERIKEALQMKEYVFKPINNEIFKRVKNTDQLLGSHLEIIGGKTGFTWEAGYNLALQVKGNNGQEIIIVVLGSQTSRDRFEEARELAVWTFDNYGW